MARAKLSKLQEQAQVPAQEVVPTPGEQAPMAWTILSKPLQQVQAPLPTSQAWEAGESTWRACLLWPRRNCPSCHHKLSCLHSLPDLRKWVRAPGVHTCHSLDNIVQAMAASSSTPAHFPQGRGLGKRVQAHGDDSEITRALPLVRGRHIMPLIKTHLAL